MPSPAMAPEQAASCLLIVAPHASYRIAPYADAARAAGADVFLLAGRSTLDLPSTLPGARFDPATPDDALALALARHRQSPFHGVVATDDATAELAARIAAAIGLPFNSPSAAARTRDKLLARQCLQQGGVRVPGFAVIDLAEGAAMPAELPAFPLVLKPLSLSASRGVMRVEDRDDLCRAVRRLRALLRDEFATPELSALVETYVPGFEVALEGVLCAGELSVLALFDKPEPLVGPYFEETFYTVPSRLSADNQAAVVSLVRQMCQVLELREGPVHAECRVNEQGAWPLELAARTIGGRCARLLTLATGLSLEEVVVGHALGRLPRPAPIQGGAGVLMLPVPASGVVRRVEGIGAARAVPGVEAVEIDVGAGQVLRAWPEGGSYPGFVFARGADALAAERTLREAQRHLQIVVAPLLGSVTAGTNPESGQRNL